MKARLAQLAALATIELPRLFLRAQAAGSCVDVSDGATGGANCAKTAGAPTELGPSITSVINLLLLGIGITAVVMLIIGGFRYIFSQGNEKNISGAKDTILYSVIGLVVALLSYAIVNFVLKRF